jgi:predicted secreted protein
LYIRGFLYQSTRIDLEKGYQEKIQLRRGEELTITLNSIPTGGYSWHPVFDHNAIDIISHSVQQSSDRSVGGSTKSIFKFKARNFGTTTLTMIYKREWEQNIIEEKSYLIDVTTP